MALCSRVSRKSTLPPTMLQQPTSGVSLSKVRSTRPRLSVKRTPTPTRGCELPEMDASPDGGGGRLATNWDKALGKRKGTKEHSGVEGVTGESVPEKRDAGGVTNG